MPIFSGEWVKSIHSYVKSNEVFRCPDDQTDLPDPANPTNVGSHIDHSVCSYLMNSEMGTNFNNLLSGNSTG